MKTFFWTTIFWLLVFCGFFGYLKWINQDLGQRFVGYIIEQEVSSGACTTATEVLPIADEIKTVSWAIAVPTDEVNTKLDDIKQQLKDINEKLDIQNSNAPDAVSVSLRTTKKTNIWIFPLDGSEYKKYVMPASDDILKDTLNLLFEKSPFALVNTTLDNDGNLIITIERVPGTAFGWSAAVEQVRISIEKTAMQFSQIKKVTIVPEEVLQP